MLNSLSFYHAGKTNINKRNVNRQIILGQEIYKEFDYFIRFLHHRVLKVRRRFCWGMCTE
jgi:hypothetical protein